MREASKGRASERKVPAFLVECVLWCLEEIGFSVFLKGAFLFSFGVKKCAVRCHVIVAAHGGMILHIKT